MRVYHRGSTPRTNRLATIAANQKESRFDERGQLYASFQYPEDVSPFMRDALCFAAVHPKLTPVINEDELIVGGYLRAEGTSWNWYPDGNDSYVQRYGKNVPGDRPELQSMAERGLISPQGSVNHKVVDYANYIRTGSVELARRARKMATRATGDKQEFYLAFAMGHDTIIAHAQRYSQEALRKAETATPERAAELREIARICAKVPAQPAETFHEAIQSLWFAYMAAGDGTGRVDIYLNDFYQADLAAGRIIPEKAQELIECLMIKLHNDVFDGFINVSSVQTMTLGGMLPDGSDGCNDLTRLFLQAIRKVRLLRPTVYVRCTDDTPQDVLDLAVAALAEGLAEPSFYGDKPIIEGLTRIGVPMDEAREYALSGCTEVVSPGKGNWGAPNGWINLALLVDEALRKCVKKKDIWPAVTKKIKEVADTCCEVNAWLDKQITNNHYNATLLMPVCLERGKDFAHGGASSHYGHWEALGLPNAVDMLYAAEKLAKGTTLPELYSRLDDDDPVLFAKIKMLPKFGNDCEPVDLIAAKLITMLADALESRHTDFRKALVLGHLAGGENMHISYGMVMGATLDGRHAGQTLADSLAASQGLSTAGPTAMIRSLCRLDHSKLIAGNVSTLRLSPADVATPDACKNVTAMIRTFVKLGGSQLQINVVDAKILRAAQNDPESYRGLTVRVAGYSADFTYMGQKLQDEIIARLNGLN
jgi:formate C-acetyltransferase